jgi:hypothetical protein
MFAFLSAVLVLAFYVPYLKSIVKGSTKPIIVSWLVWAMNDTIIFSTTWIKGEFSYFLLGTCIGAIITMALSLRYGKFSWETIDLACGTIAILGIIAGFVLSEPTVALIASLVVAVTSSIPTIRSILRDRANEDRFSWTMYYIATICALISLENWSIASLAAPLTFLAVGTYCQYLFWRPLPQKNE